MTTCLCTTSVVLFFLKSDGRRLAICANPATTPISDDGFKAVASFGNTDSTAAFISRVISTVRGKVISPSGLRDFAAFATHEGLPVCTLNELKRQLRQAAEAE